MRERWEALPVRTQAYIAFPVLALVTFLLNIGPFAQPPLRSVIYGLIEGGVFTLLLVIATRNERARREGEDK